MWELLCRACLWLGGLYGNGLFHITNTLAVLIRGYNIFYRIPKRRKVHIRSFYSATTAMIRNGVLPQNLQYGAFSTKDGNSSGDV